MQIILALLLAKFLGIQAAVEEPKATIDIIHQAVKKSEADKPEIEKLENVVKIANDFLECVRTIDFSPSENASNVISNTKDIALYLTNRFTSRQGEFSDTQANSIMGAVCKLLNAFDVAIEDNYKPQKCSANISPPEGVPNAVAGMNPDAISDVKLRQQYLDAIRNEHLKGLKNSQQTDLAEARLTILIGVANLVLRSNGKDRLVEQFTDEGKSRKVLREMIAQPRRDKSGK